MARTCEKYAFGNRTEQNLLFWPIFLSMANGKNLYYLKNLVSASIWLSQSIVRCTQDHIFLFLQGCVKTYLGFLGLNHDKGIISPVYPIVPSMENMRCHYSCDFSIFNMQRFSYKYHLPPILVFLSCPETDFSQEWICESRPFSHLRFPAQRKKQFINH